MPEQHARYGGSTAARTMNCPGWRQLADTLPASGSSSYADRGTLLHDAMEKILGDDVEPKSVIGMEYEGIVLTEELYYEKIVPALAAVEEIFKKYGIEEWACEERVGLAKEVWGTGDLLGAGTAWALVLDYKFGDGVIVSPVENDQFLFYGSCAYHTAETSDLFDDIENVVFAVVQPSTHTDSDYEVWETKVSRLRDYRGQFLLAVEEAESDDPITCAGNWCKFCPASSICPEKTGAAQRALLMDPKKLDSLRESLNLCNELEDWIAAVRSKAHEQLENGADIKGWKLVMKRATRSWIGDEDAVIRKLARKLGGKKNVVTEKVITPAAAEKLAKAQEVDLKLDDMVQSRSSGTTLAPASDKRAAVLSGKAAQAALSTVN